MLTLTESAQLAVKKFIDGSEAPVAGLRVMVTGGGCSGMQYGMRLEETAVATDQVVKCGVIDVLVDPGSAEIIKGMTVDQALKVCNQDIADFLGGLPPEKMHCSVMGKEALETAVANYRGEEWADDHEEGELICKCFGIEAPMIEEQVRLNKLTTVEDVTNYTKAGGGCSTCHEKIEELIAKTWEALGEPMPAAVASPAPDTDLTPLVAPTPIAAKGKLTMVQRIRRIEEVLDAMRPTLQADGGDVELIDVDGNTVYVKMTGACSGCQAAALTLGGIQQKMMETLGEFIKVVPESEMAKLRAQG